MTASPGKRILHVATTLDAGGAENHLIQLVRGIRAQGRSVDVAYLRGDPRSEIPYRRLGARAYRLGSARRPGPLALARLVRLLREGRYGVVHAHLVEAEVAAATALLLCPGPALVVTKHNDDPFWRRSVMRPIIRFVVRRSDQVIAISDHVRRTFGALGVPEARMTTVHYGLEPAAAPPGTASLRSELRIGSQTPLVVAVGRLVPQKGHFVLLEAFALVRQHIPAAHLAILGDGEDEPALRARAERLGLTPWVHFVGWRANPTHLMAEADVIAHPSLWEGFGLVLLEAMAQARPVVATAVGAIPEVVLDGVTGRLVPPGDAVALADALTEVLADPALARALGDAGRERLEREFSVDRMVAATLAVYDRAARGT